MTAPIRPEDVLSGQADTATFDDTTVRKGTVAAFVANAKLIDDLAEDSPERDAVLEQLQRLLPGLRAVGVLDVFTPRSATIAALVDEDTGRTR